jgi:hypothetical protein
VDFGQALGVLKNGGSVTRPSWNGAFIYLVPGSTFEVNRPPLLGIYKEGALISYLPRIDKHAADGTCSPWRPSTDALLAGDWETAA